MKPADDDQALRQALRAGLPPPDGESSQALQQRVLAQWQQRQDGAATAHPGKTWHRRWLGAATLASSLAVLAWCSQPSDPALEELMQLDVLSQMAIGEM